MFREFTKYGGVVSRISGEEFAIFLYGCSSKEEARALIRKLYRASERFSLLAPDGSEQKIRYSSGIAWYPDDSDNLTDLLKLSDYAMYEAKQNQKGTAFEFNPESYEKNALPPENRGTTDKPV
jgi:diguanylate cyclase (GGDEF)-like protein